MCQSIFAWSRRGRISPALLLLAPLLLHLPATVRAQEKESVAVMDMEGRGISTIEAQTLTDRMRSELVRTGAVTVVERGQMQTILAEQDFQLTGCTSDECAVEIGQLLGVSMMITGSVGKIGSTYTLDLRTIDIATGAIANTMTRDYRGEIDGLIKEIEHISWELVGLVHPDDLLNQLGGAPSSRTLDDVGQRGPQAQVAPKKGGRGLLWLAVLAAVGGGGYYAYTQLGGEESAAIGTPPPFPTQ